MSCIEHHGPYLDDAVQGIVKAVKEALADKPAADPAADKDKVDYKELVRNAIK